jgi:hypothetical protein
MNCREEATGGFERREELNIKFKTEQSFKINEMMLEAEETKGRMER